MRPRLWPYLSLCGRGSGLICGKPMASKSSSPLERTFVTILKYGAYAGLVGLVALIVAVGIAMSQLPSYSELVRRDDLGQMIRVRANDGTVIVSLGPSFGEWLSFDEIPPIMREIGRAHV